MSAIAVAFAKRIAMNKLRKFAGQAQAQANRKAREMAQAAERRVNAGMYRVVNQHYGNNQRSRALANSLKRHVTNNMNRGRNNIRITPPPMMR